MSTCEVFKQFYHKLVAILPMNDVTFTAQLFSHNLLPGNLNDQVKSLATASDKAAHFLDCAIKPAVTIGDDRSFNELLNVMEDSEYCNVKELAQQIKSKLKNIADTTTDLCSESIANLTMEELPTKKTKESTALDVAADGLRSRYLGQLPTAKADWPKHLVTSYIPLALVEKEDITNSSQQLDYITTLSLRGVDRILKKKKPIYDLKEIFHYNDEPIPRLILIMGGPGIGKTTMANEICVKWARDGFLSEDFTIVVLITLRAVQQRSIEDVVIKRIGGKAYQLLKESLGKKCLIILEGLDEMTTEQQQNDSLLIELIKDVPIGFVEATIVITSRPNACQELKANRTIEIIGLGDNEIMEFVRNSFPGDTRSVEAFSKQLDEYPQLYSLCYVPMSLVMIVRIFKHKQQSLPSTMTELYRLFIVMALIREEKKLITKHSVSTTAVDAAEEILSKVFADIPSNEVKTVLSLSKLAYYGYFEWHKEGGWRRNRSKVIFTENDLMQSGIEVTDHYDGHGLLQVETLDQLTGDCLTYNFMHLSVQEFLCAVYMLTLSQEEQYHLLEKYFDVYPNVLIFYCGLTRLDCHQIIYSKLKKSHSFVVEALKCLYEGQWNTESRPPFSVNIDKQSLLPYDCLCLSYVYCHYPVTHLNMEECRIGDKNIGILAKWCLYITTKLQELYLSSNYLTSEGMKHVKNIVKSSPLLRILDVSYNNIGDNGLSLITEGLRYNHTLTELHAWGCRFSVEGAISISEMIKISHTLKVLEITYNPIGDEGIAAIARTLDKASITKLNVGNCNITVTGAKSLAEGLINNITVTGAKSLAEGLINNRTIRLLNVCYNDIAVDGTIAILEAAVANGVCQEVVINKHSRVDKVKELMTTLRKRQMV